MLLMIADVTAQEQTLLKDENGGFGGPVLKFTNINKQNAIMIEGAILISAIHHKAKPAGQNLRTIYNRTFNQECRLQESAAGESHVGA